MLTLSQENIVAKTAEGFVNFIGDNKRGGGQGMYVSGIDGWVRIAKKVGTVEGLVKRAKIKLKYGTNSEGDFVATALKVLAPPSDNQGGGKWKGRGGGGGYKKDPAVQRSIVMQHSQGSALAFLAILIDQGGIKLPASNKPAARKLALEELLDEQTRRFYTQAAEDGAEEFADSDEADDVADESEDDDVDDDADSDDDSDFDSD